MTKTLATGRREADRSAAAQQRDQLAALALGEPAEGLARRDPALAQDLVDLHAPVLGDGEQQVEHLGRLQIVRRIEQQLMDGRAARLEVALELRATAPDIVGTLQRLHALHE